MPSFLDYYNDELRKRGASTAGGPSVVVPEGLKGVKFGGNAPADNAFLGAGKWLLDILDRPRNAIATTISEGMDNAKVVAENVAKDGAAGLLSGNPFGAGASFFKGLTSNDPKDKHYASDLIEHGTDVIGSLDPNYVDQKDNVNPVLKGVLGFVGDVATDPLTYVPGAAFLKAGKTVAGLADKGLTAASKALVGAKDAGKAAEVGADLAKVSKAEEAVQVAAKETPKLDANDLFAGGIAEPRPTGGALKAAEQTPSIIDELRSVGKTAAPAAPEVAAQAPKLDVLQALMKAPEAPKINAVTNPAVTSRDVGQVTMNDLVAASDTRTPVTKALDAITQRQTPVAVPETPRAWSDTLLPDQKIPGAQATSQKMSMAEYRALRDQRNTLVQQVQAGDSAAKGPLAAIDTRLKPYSESLRKAYNNVLEQAASGPKTAQSAFESLMAKASTAANVENSLGPELTSYLRRAHTPQKFDKLIQDIGNVVNLKGDTADILRNTDRGLSNVLADRLGVPRVAKPNTPEEATAAVQDILRKDDEYQKGISSTVQSVIAKELDQGAYPFKLDKDGLKLGRTTLSKGEGTGRYFEQFNVFTQMSISRKLLPMIERAYKLSDQARGARGSGFTSKLGGARTQAFKDAKLQALTDTAKALDQLGLSVVIGYGNKTSMLSFDEVYRGLLASADERGVQHLTDMALFNQGTEVLETHLMTAVNDAIHGASRESVLETLTSTRKLGAKGELSGEKGAITPKLVKPSKTTAYTSYEAAAQAAERDLGIPRSEVKAYITKKEEGRVSRGTGAQRKQNVFYVNYYAKGVNRLAENLADTVMDAAAPLRIRAAENEANYLARAGAEAADISSTVLKGVEEALAAPTGVAAKTDAFGLWKKAPVEEGARIAATPDGVASAQAMVEAGMGSTLVDDIKALKSFESAPTPKAAAEANAEEVFSSVKTQVKDKGRANLDDQPDPDFPSVQDRPSNFNAPLDDLFAQAGEDAVQTSKVKSPTVDLSQDADKMVDAFGQRIQDPYSLLKHKVRTWFDQNYKMGQAHPIFARWQNKLALRSSYISSQLNAINAAGVRAGDKTGDLVRSAFTNVQKGVTSTNPQSAEIEKMISGVLEDYFDLTGHSLQGNSLFRISGNVDAVNAALANKGIKHAFEPGDDLATQWRQWDIQDPLDFMHRLNLAREELALNVGVAKSFVQLAKDTGAYSDKAAPGFVRMEYTGKSRFGVHIPEGTYVKKELAHELQQVETMLRQSREFSGGLGEAIRKYYAPTLNAWKRTITIMRPGHHVRNYIGSTSATWVRRGFNELRRSHEDALKILSQHNSYRDVDMLAGLTRDGLEQLPQRGDTLLSLGKRGDIKVDEAYAFLAENGMLPGFRVGEDFLPSEGALSSVMEKLTFQNTKVGKFAGSVSEYVDHFTRAQHFMQAIRQDAKRFPGKSKKQLMESALTETSKYHPDASMLTPTEAKLRLAIPFYTWFSKMMPALVESAVMYPGRVTMLTKASFNAAIAAGIDPNSLQDPFPDDQLFPSFIKENPMGPQMNWGGSYIRLNPGFAHLDVMNTFGADPFRGVLGMTTPLVRVPFELMAGSSLQTGARINDKSDYLDQSIPFINYLSNLTGTSITGSVPSLLSGQGLDPQKGYQPKADGTTNKTGLDQGITALNWLTGLGVQNLSRPSYINYSEIEKRNQASQKGTGF